MSFKIIIFSIATMCLQNRIINEEYALLSNPGALDQLFLIEGSSIFYLFRAFLLMLQINPQCHRFGIST